LVLRVHHVEQSSSAERSKRSVLINDSPCVVGNVSAKEIVVVQHCLLWDVESSNGDEGSIRLFPLGQEVVDWVEARILLELQLEVETVASSSQSTSHVLSQVVGGSSWWERESNGGGVVAWPQSVLNGSLWKRSRTELVRRNGIERHGEQRGHRVVGKLHGKDCSVGGESLSESRGTLLSSSAKNDSGHNGSRESSLVLGNKDGEGVEDHIHLVVVFKSREVLPSWNIAELDSNSLNVSTSVVLNLFVLSREPQKCWISGSWLEESSCVLSWKVRTDGKGSVGTSNGWGVEGSSVSSRKVSLGLEFSEVRIEIIVYLVDVTKGEGRLFTQAKVLAVCSNITSTTESWLSIWEGERRSKGIGHNLRETQSQ